MQKTLFRRLRRRGDYESLPGDDPDAASLSNSEPKQLCQIAAGSGNEDAQSFTDSVISGRQYSSFATRSTTSSMNNFAEFSVSVDVIEDQEHPERSLHGSKYENDEDYVSDIRTTNDNNSFSRSASKSKRNSNTKVKSGSNLLAPTKDPVGVPSLKTSNKNSVNSQLASDDDDDVFEHLEKVVDEDDVDDSQEEKEILNEEEQNILTVSDLNADKDPVV